MAVAANRAQRIFHTLRSRRSTFARIRLDANLLIRRETRRGLKIVAIDLLPDDGSLSAADRATTRASSGPRSALCSLPAVVLPAANNGCGEFREDLGPGGLLRSDPLFLCLLGR